jgi:hypothetical protein
MAGLLPSGSVAERDGVTAAIGWLRARNDVHASLPCGDPDRLRRPRTSRPFACWDGLPPRRLRGQGSLRAPECSLGLQPSLDRSGVDAARRHRSPGAGEEPVPDQQARGTDRGGPPLGPPPEPAPAHPSTRKEDQAPVRTTIATEEPAPSLSPEEGTACPTPTSPSSAT